MRRMARSAERANARSGGRERAPHEKSAGSAHLTWADLRRPERAAAAAAAAAAMPAMRAVPAPPLATVPTALAVPAGHVQVVVSALQGWLKGGSGRIGRGKWRSEGGGAPKLTSRSTIDPGLPPPNSNAAPGAMVASQPWPRRASRLLLLRAPAGSLWAR